MNYYLFVTARVTDWNKFARYAELAAEHIKECGGEYIIRKAESEMLEGVWDEDVKVVISKWKSKEDALNFFNGDKYQKEIKPLRDGTGKFMVRLIKGC